MSSVVISGDISGSVTLDAPSVAGTTVLTLPATSGTVVVTATGQAGFPSGTRMAFQQTAAPTGWTKDTTAAINDSILRLVTGTASSGGSLAFSSWAAQTTDGAVTLASPQIPSHSHNVNVYFGGGSPAATTRIGSTSTGGALQGTDATSSTGGGGSHTHPLSQSLKYYDFIIATAN